MKYTTHATRWYKQGGALAGRAGKTAKAIGTAYDLLDAIDRDTLLERDECALCRKLEIEYDVRLGEYNGYGYERLGQECTDDTAEATAKVAAHIAALKKEFAAAPKKPAGEKKQHDPVSAWCRRLDKLTGCGLKVAEAIAEAKEEYKQECIQAMEDRQYTDRYSEKRATLIRKMERKNPLRRITDTDHAEAILAAHRRHTTTNYESQLDEARERAQWGEIDRSEIKEYARAHMA